MRETPHVRSVMVAALMNKDHGLAVMGAMGLDFLCAAQRTIGASPSSSPAHGLAARARFLTHGIIVFCSIVVGNSLAVHTLSDTHHH